MAQTLKYSANFKRNYMMFLAFALFALMIIAELLLALSIPRFVQRENAYAREIRKREMFLLFDDTRKICGDIKERSENIKLEKRLVSDTLDYLAIYLRREADRLTPEDVNALYPQIKGLNRIALQLRGSNDQKVNESFSQENQLSSAAYLNSLLKKYDNPSRK